MMNIISTIVNCIQILMKMMKARKKILSNIVAGNVIKLSNLEQKRKSFQEFIIFFNNIFKNFNDY